MEDKKQQTKKIDFVLKNCKNFRSKEGKPMIQCEVDEIHNRRDKIDGAES